ncbi:anti-sigma-K factor RskA [Kribbella aluminosa]|uniref:Anti-sigma-K factor RskA n=1 Tax=Kribbella aluminosa TaxID=416017 RepID=A0ABS4UFR1_9ACTN|nr:hypothetical protein [Kribbella aluminosa]MBP2350440.1 anti-sigma-K factor RskA [Kribbella aluminosa]
MNPVDEMDDLLKRAGARWRADQVQPPEPDLERTVGGRRKSWIPAVAAASVAVVVAGALAVLPNHTTGGAAAMNSQSSTPRSLLVKPGDRVQVSGLVIAAPGTAQVFCALEDGFGVGYAPGDEPAPNCAPEFSIALTGVDLNRLSDAKTTKGVRSGRAKLVGIWGDRTIDVQEQSAPETPVRWAFPELPCPAPAGGWVSKPSNIYSPAVTAFLAAHADQIYGPVIHYPNGHSRNAPLVIMVGVAHGDVDAFRLAFEEVYRGNLCVAPVLLSRADNERIQNALVKLTSDKSLGILAVADSGPSGGRIGVPLIAYTEQVRTAFTPIGLDDIEVQPVVKPAG